MEHLYRDDAYLKSCEAEVVSADHEGIRLTRSIFYPTGGGQPGDRGLLRLDDGNEISIVDTRKGADLNDVVLVPSEGAALPAPGARVTAELDWERRHKHMRMHTAMHIVCSLIEFDVTGGQVGEEKSRLDFNMPESPDKAELTERLNQVIAENHAVTTRWITDEEMAANQDLVRTMSVKPPTGFGKVRLLEIEGVDLQPCGGTHVASTGEIGEMIVAKIENKGKQNRRVNIRFAPGAEDGA